MDALVIGNTMVLRNNPLSEERGSTEVIEITSGFTADTSS
jgi:hypothetical protein